MYGADVLATHISRVTDAVLEQVIEWQLQSLDTVYQMVHLDCIVVKIQQGKRLINKTIYWALDINMAGHKEMGVPTLAQRAHRTLESRREGYSDCLC